MIANFHKKRNDIPAKAVALVIPAKAGISFTHEAVTPVIPAQADKPLGSAKLIFKAYRTAISVVDSCLRRNDRRGIVLLVFLFCSLFSFAQEVDYKKYSYTEFFEMIEQEQDTIFKLEDAIIEVNLKTDKKYLGYLKVGNRDSIFPFSKERIQINKEIQFTNVQFKEYANRIENKNVKNGLVHILFNKKVTILDSYNIEILSCRFNEGFSFNSYNYFNSSKIHFEKYFKTHENGTIRIQNNTFNENARISISFSKKETAIGAYIRGNKFLNPKRENTFLGFFNTGLVLISNNLLNSSGLHYLKIEQAAHGIIEENSFSKGLPAITCIEVEELLFTDNTFNTDVLFDFNIYNNLTSISNNQFKTSISSWKAYTNLLAKNFKGYLNNNHDSIFNIYNTQYKVQDESTYNYEIEQKSEFYNYFKSKFNTKAANTLYVEMKDLETERLQYLYNQDPSFDAFFTFKINQFLNVFSAYGTRPSKAIIFSLYVILFFALVYLFFPNSWDRHGKNRIVDRYNFFFKYMKRKAGIHEVYMEDQKEELMSYEQFKANISNSKQKVPKFFTATALPLYKWAVSGTKLSAGVLRRIDIMKGSWDELPNSKRIWKSILLIGAFMLAIVYDIIIKVLNALMLSINTFTTLGFGEIPIKGLPRYLAIVQGFIGWFMLTIFSVSLISQLLN